MVVLHPFQLKLVIVVPRGPDVMSRSEAGAAPASAAAFTNDAIQVRRPRQVITASPGDLQ
jgi:hypothetical protein